MGSSTDPKNANIELSINQSALSPFWVAGKIDSNGTMLTSKGRYSFTSILESTGVYLISFTPSHPDGIHYVINTTTATRPSYAQLLNVGIDDTAITSTSFKLIVQHPATTEFNAPVWFSVLA